jgi:hypothetical protein
MRDPALLRAVYANRARARKLRELAKEQKAVAELAIARARSLGKRVRKMDDDVEQATEHMKQKVTLRDDALRDLEQSLHDLESLRMTTSSERSKVTKLKADIRKTLDRAR